MKKADKPKVIAMIPTGEQTKFSVFYADSFEQLLDNGKLHLSGTDGVTLSSEKVEQMQGNIKLALDKLNDYVKELELAQYFLNNIKESKLDTKKTNKAKSK